MLVLAATVVASAYWLSPLRAEHVAKDGLAAATYVVNYRFAWLRTDYLTAHADPSPLQHYWSLGVEEQFYFLWPAVLLVAAVGWGRQAASLARTVAVVAVVGTASLALSLWLTDANQPWAFFSLPTRAWELAAGAAIALSLPWLRRVPPWLAVAAPPAETAATPRTGPAGREPSPAAAAPDPVTVAGAPVLAAVARSVDRRELPSNLDPPLRRASGDRARPFLDGCHAGFTEARLRPCVYAHAQSPTGVMLVGDSHATQWFPALDRVAAERGWTLVSLTKSTCPPFPIPVWSPDLGRHYRECDAWRDAVLARIRADRPAAVVLGVARHYGPEFRFEVHSRAWLDGLAEMVRRVQAEGARAVVLGPTPLPAGDVPDCLSSNPSQVVACTQPKEEGVDLNALGAERGAVDGAGGVYVDVTPWFCTPTCAVVVDNLLVYRDDNHLTTSYASWLAPVVGAHLDRAVARR
jgi:hypothetical protein